MSKTKVNLTPSQISEKWNRRMKSAVSDIQAGIESVAENPCEKASSKADKWQQRISEADTKNRFVAGLKQVSLADWKAKAKEKVATRLASGVDGAMDKRSKFDNYLVNAVNGSLAQIKNMPDVTIEDSINRVRAHITYMHEHPYKK